MSSSVSESYVKDDVLDIITTSIRNIGGKNMPLNVPNAPLDHVSFHFLGNVQKLKFVCQRRTDAER